LFATVGLGVVLDLLESKSKLESKTKNKIKGKPKIKIKGNGSGHECPLHTRKPD